MFPCFSVQNFSLSTYQVLNENFPLITFLLQNMSTICVCENSLSQSSTLHDVFDFPCWWNNLNYFHSNSYLFNFFAFSYIWLWKGVRNSHNICNFCQTWSNCMKSTKRREEIIMVARKCIAIAVKLIVNSRTSSPFKRFKILTISRLWT